MLGAPVAQGVERDLHPGDGAKDVLARLEDGEFTVPVVELGKVPAHVAIEGVHGGNVAKARARAKVGGAECAADVVALCMVAAKSVGKLVA